MGYLRPTAIIVTASCPKDIEGRPHWIDLAHQEAVSIFDEGLVSPVVDSITNGVRSFLVAWDGSKEGWGDSDTGDVSRERLIEWLRAQAYSDHSSPLDWIEVQYGGDDQEGLVLSHSGDRLA